MEETMNELKRCPFCGAVQRTEKDERGEGMTEREAIEWFLMLKAKFIGTVYEKYLDYAISVLKKQKTDRWIPVTERLPEEESCYLVTVKNDHERRYSKTAWYSGDGWFARQDIIAWRSTPEPYKEKKS